MSRTTDGALGTPEKEVALMISLDLNSLWFIPVALAAAFMVWVAWNLEKDSRSNRARRRRVPIPPGSNIQDLVGRSSNRAVVRLAR